MASLSHGDPVGIVPQALSLHELQQLLDGVDVRVGQPKAWLWNWVVAELVIPIGVSASSPLPVVRDGAISPESRGQLSCEGQGQLALLLQCLERGRASKGRGRLRMVLWFHHAWFLWIPEVTWATDVSTDPSYSWTVDSDMALSSNLGPANILALGGSTGHSDGDGSGSGMDPQTPPRPQVVVCLFGNTTDSSGIQKNIMYYLKTILNWDISLVIPACFQSSFAWEYVPPPFTAGAGCLLRGGTSLGGSK